jgi:hypothetical protein
LGKNIKEYAVEIITILPDFTINENSLFDDCSHVQIYAAESKITEWNNTTCEIRHRSLHILSGTNCLQLHTVTHTMPGSNACRTHFVCMEFIMDCLEKLL